MNHLDLFSGIGGFHLAGEWVWGDEFNTICHVEIDPFCQKVLNKHWPDVPIHDDIRSYKHDGTNVDILTGGFPCQPFSVAGKQGGKEDNRYLWPAMLEVIKATRPTWIIGENVAGIIRMELDNCLSDLEAEGYSTQCFVIPACAKDAPHRRDRVWIIANSKKQGLERAKPERDTCPKRLPTKLCEDVANSEGRKSRQQTKPERRKDTCRGSEKIITKHCQWSTEPNVGRVAHGIPNRMDRLKSLGNAIVPQVVVPIMQAIKEIEEKR